MTSGEFRSQNEQTDNKWIPAKDLNIELLKYVDNTLQWKCTICGEVWQTTIDKTKRYQNKVVCPHKQQHGLNFSLDELRKLDLNRTIKEVQDRLYNEYDNNRNNKSVDNVTIGETTPRVWECEKCGYHWKQAPIERFNIENNKVNDCPRCQGIPINKLKRKKRQKKTLFGLAYSRPKFISYFDIENNDSSVFEIANKTASKLKWKCYRCGYKWERQPVYSFAKYICPACQNLVIKGQNDLQQVCKEAQENYDKNYNIKDVSEIHFRTKAKLHWKCSKCGHTSTISPNDVCKYGRICLYCDTVGNRYPELLNYLAYSDSIDKIRNTRIDSVLKAKWKCENGHTYTMPIRERIQNFYGCPACREKEWAFTKLKRILRNKKIQFKIVKNIPKNNQLTGCLVIGEKVFICVTQEYNKESNKDNTYSIQELALKSGYKFYQVIETTDENITDIERVYEQFIIPMDYQEINIEQIVKWLIHYENISNS